MPEPQTFSAAPPGPGRICPLRILVVMPTSLPGALSPAPLRKVPPACDKILLDVTGFTPRRGYPAGGVGEMGSTTRALPPALIAP